MSALDFFAKDLMRRRDKEARRRGGIARQAMVTPEERERMNQVLARARQWVDRLTPEERHRWHQSGGYASMAKRSREEIVEMALKAQAKLTKEIRRKAGRKGWENMKPEHKERVLGLLRANASRAAKARKWENMPLKSRQRILSRLRANSKKCAPALRRRWKNLPQEKRDEIIARLRSYSLARRKAAP